MNYSWIESIFGPVSAVFDNDTTLRCLIFENPDKLSVFFPNIHLNHAPQLNAIIQDIITNKKKILFKAEGTPFQEVVWKELLNIPEGETTTYQQVANNIQKSTAVRAVATAIGKNPISYVIPCHRVIASNGSLGGYRWGLKIKKELLSYERSL